MVKDKAKEKKKRNLNTVEHSIKKKEKTNIFRKNRLCIDWKKKEKSWTFVNFDCGHIVILFWLVQNGWKIRKKKLFELKDDIRIFFPFHIMKFDENH